MSRKRKHQTPTVLVKMMGLSLMEYWTEREDYAAYRQPSHRLIPVRLPSLQDPAHTPVRSAYRRPRHRLILISLEIRYWLSWLLSSILVFLRRLISRKIWTTLTCKVSLTTRIGSPRRRT